MVEKIKEEKRKRNSELLLQDKAIDDNHGRLAVWKYWLQGFVAPVCGTRDSQKHPYGDIKLRVITVG